VVNNNMPKNTTIAAANEKKHRSHHIIAKNIAGHGLLLITFRTRVSFERG